MLHRNSLLISELGWVTRWFHIFYEKICQNIFKNLWEVFCAWYFSKLIFIGRRIDLWCRCNNLQFPDVCIFAMGDWSVEYIFQGKWEVECKLFHYFPRDIINNCWCFWLHFAIFLTYIWMGYPRDWFTVWRLTRYWR